MALSAPAAQKALVAFQRFGLGPKPGGPTEIGADPVAALKAEVNTPNIALIPNNNGKLPSYVLACRLSQNGFDRAEDIRNLEMNARVDKQMAVQIGFVERWVMFWSNHFAMSVNKDDTVRGVLGQWERDVVRANALGKFVDMLKGTTQHPAMIKYLDNEDSIGPHSEAGLNWGAGLNENLAREIMELHTVGSGSGSYTEKDVTAFAKILTGWSFVRGWEADGHYNGGKDTNRGQFIYRKTWHEPGDVLLRGKTYTNNGMRMTLDVLDDLAADPWTAQHIAFKLVRHFITDEPTTGMVDAIKNVFISSGGDLKAVALALIDLPESWSTPLTKLKNPYEQQIAQYRALGKRYANNNTWVFSEPLRALYQMAWEQPSPEGWSDETPTWLNPDALRVRLDLAQFASWEFKPDYPGDVHNLAVNLFDSALSAATLAGIDAAAAPGEYDSNNNALTILLSCPEFQRR
jgi:uncharacterized protein (DUF1800 family)